MLGSFTLFPKFSKINEFGSRNRLLTFHAEGIEHILVIFKKPIFPVEQSFYWSSYQGGSPGTNFSFHLEWRLTSYLNINKCFNLPVGLRVKIHVLKPREIRHNSFDGSRVHHIIMPIFSIKRWNRRNSKVYLIVTVGIQGSTISTIKNEVMLISYDKINTRGFFIRFKISWFKNDWRFINLFFIYS